MPFADCFLSPPGGSQAGPAEFAGLLSSPDSGQARRKESPLGAVLLVRGPSENRAGYGVR